MFGKSVFFGSASQITIEYLGKLDIPEHVSKKFDVEFDFSEPIFVAMGHYDVGDGLHILVRETEYESFYNLKRLGYNIRGLSVQAIVVNSKEEFLLEKRADWLSFNPSKVGFFGGGVKSSDLEGEVIRECKEELGCDAIRLRNDECIVMQEGGPGFLCVVFLNVSCDAEPPYIGSDEGEVVRVPCCELSDYNQDELAPSLIGAIAAIGKEL